jgi:hypothetical protein
LGAREHNKNALWPSFFTVAQKERFLYIMSMIKFLTTFARPCIVGIMFALALIGVLDNFWHWDWNRATFFAVVLIALKQYNSDLL